MTRNDHYFLQISSIIFGFLITALFLNLALDTGMYFALLWDIPWQVGYGLFMIPIFLLLTVVGMEYGNFMARRWLGLPYRTACGLML